MDKYVRVIFDKSKAVKQSFLDGALDAIKQTCLELEADAQQRAPRDTGALAASIYHIIPTNTSGTATEDNYNKAKSKATALARKRMRSNARKKGIKLKAADMKNAFKMAKKRKVKIYTGEIAGYVAVGAHYRNPVEFGTKKMPAKPFFYPAVENATRKFDKHCAEKLGAKLGKI